jgi:hypothetical protein
MGELLLPVSIMIFTIFIAGGCLYVANSMMAKRDKIVEGWLHKSGGH